MTLSKNSSPDLTSLFDDLATFYTTVKNKRISREDIFKALFLMISDSANLEWAGHLWFIELSDTEAKLLLNDFDFDTLKTIIELDTDIFPIDVLVQIRVLIKDKGLKWIIHKNDIDPFPSNPHAHCYEQNLKLDLSNGFYYRNRKYQGKLNEKDFFSMRDKVVKVYNGDLPAIKTKG
jgi:hypothetical protein